jgi:hypothetical protein
MSVHWGAGARMTARAVRPTMRPVATAEQSLLAPDSARNPFVALRMQCACATAKKKDNYLQAQF